VTTTNHIFPISQKQWGHYEEERNVRLSLTSHMNIPPCPKGGGEGEGGGGGEEEQEEEEEGEEQEEAGLDKCCTILIH